MNRPISAERLRELATVKPNTWIYAETAAELRALASEVLELRDVIASERAQHKANLEGFDTALTTEQYERSLIELSEQQYRIERDQARRELAAVKAERDEILAAVDDLQRGGDRADYERVVSERTELQRRVAVLTTERDDARAELVVAMQTIEAAAEADAETSAFVREQVEQPGEIEEGACG